MLYVFISTLFLSLPLYSNNFIEEDFFYKLPIDPYYCKNNLEICQKLQEKQIDLSNLEFSLGRKPASKAMWFTFATLQLLDVYTTDRGMRYDCVKELNPLLPERPTVRDMIVLKAFILYPTYYTVNQAFTITDQDLIAPSIITSAVVVNNYHVNRRASKNCLKIR